MDLLIVYDGSRGHTVKAVEAMARAAATTGAKARAVHIDLTDPDEVGSAHALVAGCWVKGNVPFGGPQFGRMADWMERMPSMGGRPAGAFCTYGFFPMFFADAVAHTGEALALMRAGLEAKGANVVATRAIHRRSAEKGAADFVTSVLQHVAV